MTWSTKRMIPLFRPEPHNIAMHVAVFLDAGNFIPNLSVVQEPKCCSFSKLLQTHF